MNMKAAGTDGLASWLHENDTSLAFSTYRANRLAFLGHTHKLELKLHERLFDRPMGLCVDGDHLWMAARWQVWRFDNLLERGELHEGADRLYVPAASFTTGEVDAHEMALLSDGRPLFVNTAFSCLATLEPGASFVPMWQPPFVSKLSAEDRCHLNGVAVVDGVPTWATACGSKDSSSGWRDQRADGGVVIHIPSNSIAVGGLSMPHSPRWHGGKLWLLNSGKGEFGYVDGDRFVPVAVLPGFARGLAFVGGCAVVGLSKLRSPQFTGLLIEQRLQEGGAPGGMCGLIVIELATGKLIHRLDLPEPIDELFDVVALPGVREPRAMGLQAEDVRCLVKIPGRSKLVTVRPKAPSDTVQESVAIPVAGLPGAADPVRYQTVLHMTRENIAPYSALTFPPIAPGTPGFAAITGELVGISATMGGTMIGLALAEPTKDGASRLCSLMVEPGYRRRGVATRLVLHLQRLAAEQGASEMAVSYAATAEIATRLEPLLARLRWSQPQAAAPGQDESRSARVSLPRPPDKPLA